MTRTFKKSFTMLMLVLVLALTMAVPAFAASQSYTFLQPDGSPSHASEYIVGAAEVNGDQIQITLSGNYYPQLVVSDSGQVATRSVVGGNTVFTFTGDVSGDNELELSIQIVTPVFTHNEVRTVVLHWL